MGIDKIIEERHATRLKHLEDPNYRRWSDLVDTKSYNYGARMNSSMLASYLANELINGVEVDGTDRNVIRLIKANLDNPDINWKGMFAYLDEELANIAKLDVSYMAAEVETLASLLNPYRDKVITNITFIGY